MLTSSGRIWKNRGSWGATLEDSLPLPLELNKYRSLAKEAEDLEATRQRSKRYFKLMLVPRKELEQWGDKKVSFQGEARIQVEEVVQLAVVPFGDDFTVKSLGMNLRGRVSSKQDGRTGFFVTIDGSNLITFPFGEPLGSDGLGVILVNSERGEFLRLKGGGGSRGNTMRILEMESNFGLYNPEEVFASEAEREAWLEDCEVRIYAREWKGSFVRKVELPGVSMEKLLKK